MACVAAACAALAGPALSQQSARIGDDLRAAGSPLDGGGLPSGGQRLYWGVSLEQTFSDMQDRPNQPNGVESIIRIEPFVRLTSRSGRVQGYLNYSGNYFYRAGREDSTGSEWQNYLDANALAEVVPGWAFLDTRASIRQQSISAFGQPVGNGRLANDNRTEVSTLWLSPYVNGVLGGAVDYNLRLIGSLSNSSAAGTQDSRYGAALASIGSEGRRQLGWRLAAKSERVEYTGIEPSTTSTTNRVNGALIWSPDIDWRFEIDGGWESADVGGPVRQQYENYGAGFTWTPSPRTKAVAKYEERYFGRGHLVLLEHRTAQSVFSYSDIRNDNQGGIDPFNLGRPTTIYDLLFQQFAAIEPDPARREQMVRDYLALIGRDPNEVVYGGQLTQGITIERRQYLGWALTGRRNTLSLQAFRTETERIDPAASAVPGGNEMIVQTGYSAALSHRLTPDLALSLLGSYLVTDPTATQEGTNQKQAIVALTSRLGRRTTGSLGARYTVFDSPDSPYRETELIGRIRFEF